jgi:pimeloyl-ACP methyl ester carboxylesterase
VDGLDVSLEYAWIGTADARGVLPLLVFLHEGLGAAGGWGDWPQRLCDTLGCRGLLFSRYGYGGSQPRRVCAGGEGWPADYLERQADRYLPALFEALGIDAARTRPVLLGHSDGATIALLYASTFPDVAGAVVAIAPHVFVENVAREGIAQLRANRAAGTARGSRLEQHLASLHNDPAGVFEGWSERWVSAAFAAWDISESLSALSCPLLLIQGRQDQFGTLAQLAAIGGQVPHAAISVLEDCRHVPHEEHPALTSTIIVSFLKKHFS